MLTNIQKLQAALAIAIADAEYINDNKKVNKAIEALTPKSTVTATFKRLQNNAVADFLVKKDANQAGYIELNRAAKTKEYVHDRFKSYMEVQKTKEEATKLFNAAYPAVSVTDVPTEAVADEEKEAA